MNLHNNGYWGSSLVRINTHWSGFKLFVFCFKGFGYWWTSWRHNQRWFVRGNAPRPHKFRLVNAMILQPAMLRLNGFNYRFRCLLKGLLLQLWWWNRTFHLVWCLGCLGCLGLGGYLGHQQQQQQQGGLCFVHVELTNHDYSTSKSRGVQSAHIDIEPTIPAAISFIEATRTKPWWLRPSLGHAQNVHPLIDSMGIPGS